MCTLNACAPNFVFIGGYTGWLVYWCLNGYIGSSRINKVEKCETHKNQTNGYLGKDFEHQFENVIISIGCPLNRPYSNLVLSMRAVFICTT